ncbi:MAG: SIS domain-containing protein [Eubacteriales bacterium]|nr:SIS domain-containing protein [Eubacteriales bacterium]
MEKDFSSFIDGYINLLKDTLSKLDTEEINKALNALLKAYKNEKTVYIFGNGGSAATASHFQNDFNKGISEYTQKKFRFCCLNDNIATVLAIANDISFDEIFRFQLDGRIEEGDLVIAISGSGNSENVLRAVRYAKEKGNTVIGLTGFLGGELKKLSDINLHAPVNSMQVTEDIHMVFDHLMMAAFYKTLANKDHLRK